MPFNQVETPTDNDDSYTGLRCSFCNAPTKMVCRNSNDKPFHACKACKEEHKLEISVTFK